MKHLHLILLVLIAFITSAHADNAKILETYGKIPLAFTVNQGQIDSQVKFTATGSGCGMFFTPTGTTFLLSRETKASVAKRAAKKSSAFKRASGVESGPEVEREAFALKVAFLNANANPEVVGEDRLPWNNNYFIGSDPTKWQTDVPNYGKIRLKEVYSGIDLVYYGNKNRIKYDFMIKPGEDPSTITLAYDLGPNAGNALSINDKDELVVKTPLGDVIERTPNCYQTINGKEVGVEVAYKIIDAAANTFGFEIGDYNAEYDLCIDPELVYSTYLGGEGYDGGQGIAVDGSGNVYVTGSTNKSDYPVTSGAYNTSGNGKNNGDIFVTKLNANGSGLVYSTYLGGSYGDWGNEIAVDSAGNAYVTGLTQSSDYPLTSEAFNKIHDDQNYFVTKLMMRQKVRKITLFSN